MSNSTSGFLYAAYKDAGFTLALFMPICIKTLLGLIGACLNGALVYVTVRCKSLHDRINILLALYAGAQICGFEFSQCIAFVASCAGFNFVPLSTCFHALGAPILAFASSFVLQLAIAIDRLISVFWPLRYNTLNSTIYMLIVLLGCAVYACFDFYLILGNARSDLAETPLICQFSSLLQKRSTFTTIINLSLEFTSMFFYALIWLKMRASPHASSPGSQRIFKSLLAIIGVEIFGWCCSASTIFTLQAMKVDDLHSFFIQTPVTALAVISSGASAVILYLFSTDYRQAFRHEFPVLKWLFSSSTSPTMTVATAKQQQTAAAPKPPHSTGITPIGNVI